MMDSIYLKYPYQPVGKTRNKRPHAGRTSVHDLIAILKLRLHVASQCIQDFLEALFMFEVFSGEQEKESIIRMRMG